MRRVLHFATLLALVAAPAAFAQPLPMSAYWPHEDGRSWLYDQRFERFDVSAPPVDDLARLYFDGTTVAPGGQSAQVLKGVVTPLPTAPALASLGIPAEVNTPFMRRLWLARPELRPDILRAVTAEPCPSSFPSEGWEGVLLIPGFAWSMSETQAFAWRCNLPNTVAWLWLTSDLAPGSKATLQLIPDIVDNVYLHLTVLGLEDVTVPAGTFGNCLHVDYVVDYGTSECTSPEGDPLGTSRAETRGFIRYAPGVGPIESLEEFEVIGLTGSCPDVGLLARTTLKLNASSVPAAASSWGRLKSAYRR